MALDDLLKGLAVFQDGLKSAAINQSMQEANQKLIDINAQFNDQLNQGVDMRKAQEQMLQQKMGLAQQLAGNMIGYGADAAAIQQATNFMAPNAGQYEQRQQFQQRQALDEQQFDEQKRQFNVNSGFEAFKLLSTAFPNNPEIAELDPTLKAINTRIADQTMQRSAVEEVGKIDSWNQSKQWFDLPSSKELAAMGPDAPKTEAIELLNEAKRITGLDINWTTVTGENQAQQIDRINQRIIEVARQGLKGSGAMTDADFENFIKPLLVSKWDSDANVETKFRTIQDKVNAAKPSTPTLKLHKIDPKASDMQSTLGEQGLAALNAVAGLSDQDPRKKAVLQILQNQHRAALATKSKPRGK